MTSILANIFTALKRIGGRAVDVSVSSYQRRCEGINQRTDEFLRLPDAELKQRSSELRQRVLHGATLGDVRDETFALISAAATRTLEMRPFDVQLVAAMAIHDGKIAEMQTGEGKTLAAVLPACLNAFQGHGVHVLTFNDYLAGRDAEWMAPVYRLLGIYVSSVVSSMTPAERKTAYSSDVTYSTAKEVGFDFLRDQQCFHPSEIIQREHFFAIIDEADSILIDQGRIPLVIARQSIDDPADLSRFARLVRKMRPHVDYSIDAGRRNISYNEPGLDRLQHDLQCGELHSVKNANLLARLNLALHAEVLMRRDVDYIVREGRIQLVDELTGRVVEHRRWPWGLQAAIEAKEGLEVQSQGTILNSITLQHFLKLYGRLGGMTATAQDSAEELRDFYQTRIAVIPPNRPCVRRDLPDRIFPTKRQKLDALLKEIVEAHNRGQPVLVGTASIAESERLAERLIASGVACEVLNAKNDQYEARLIAEAGSFGAVTISTNMAGRGTDIRLGGSDEKGRDQIVALGGLFVIGTCRNESRRIDNQLRGRTGRQGDPGDSVFLVSLKDDLLQHEAAGNARARRSQGSEVQILDDAEAGERIAHIQRVIEGENLEVHRTLRKYTFVLEQQRQQFQRHRIGVMTGTEPPHIVRDRDFDLFQTLVTEFGQTTFESVERQIALRELDNGWSNHLERVAEIREGIHLVSMGGLNPIDVFNLEVVGMFRSFFTRAEAETVSAVKDHFKNRERTGFEDNAINGSSATWTYMINDNPMGDLLQRIGRRAKEFFNPGA